MRTAIEQGARPAAPDGLALEHRACPSCRRDNADQPPHPDGRDGWTVKRCADCGFIYIENPPVYAELAEAVSFDKTFVAAAEAKKRRHPILQGFSKATRWRLHLFPRKTGYEIIERRIREGVVIDLGCGRGGYLLQLPERYRVIGVEISKAMAEFADAKLRPRGGRVINAPSVEGLLRIPEGTADCVTMRSYLEHESRPREVLEATFKTLKPGGAAIIKVPNHASWNRRIMGRRWCGFRFPDHVNYFTPDSLRRMTESAGLRVKRFSLLDRMPTDDNMWLVAERPR